MYKLKNRKNSFHKFLIIWFGELISSIGSGLSSFGLGVYVFTQTGLASATAIVTLCGFLPSLLLNPITGVLADRYDRRLLMIIGDSLSATGLIYILFCLICIAGFLFFATLPFANISIDVLIRSNIDNKLQGRAWGLISLISQFGSVAAYASVGFLADYVFTPLLTDNGLLAGTIGRIIGTGAGRGTGFLIIIAGAILAISACFICKVQSIRKLEVVNVSTNYKE